MQVFEVYSVPSQPGLAYLALAYCPLFYLRVVFAQHYSKESKRCFNCALATTLSHLFYLTYSCYLSQFLLLYSTTVTVRNFCEAWECHASVAEEFWLSLAYMGSVFHPAPIVAAIIYCLICLLYVGLRDRKRSSRPNCVILGAILSLGSGLSLCFTLFGYPCSLLSEFLGVCSYLSGLCSLPRSHLS